MSDLQIRRRPATRVEAATEGEGVVIAYVSVYDVEYRVGPFGQREIIEKGAFDQSIKDKGTVPFFWSHNWPFGLMIGDTALSSDDKGLIATATLDMDDELGRRVFRRIKSGALDEYSIGYMVTMARFDPDDEDLERVVEAQCIEASSVVLGANPDTDTIEVRAASDLVAPVFSVDGDGVLKVQWVPAQPPKKKGGDEPPEEPERLAVSSEAGTINLNITVSGGNQPAATPPPDEPVDPARAHELLREPAFRDALREQLSSSGSTSGT